MGRGAGGRPLLQGEEAVVGGVRRGELRRGQLARARRARAPSPRRARHHRQVVRAHPRDQPEEAGSARAHLRQALRLRLRPAHRPRLAPHRRQRYTHMIAARLLACIVLLYLLVCSIYCTLWTIVIVINLLYIFI